MQKIKFLEKLYIYFKNHWVISTIFMTLQSTFAIVATYYGRELGLVSNSTKGYNILTVSGFIIFCVLYLMTFLISLSNNYYASYYDKNELTSNKILRHLMRSTYSICRKKYWRFVNQIKGMNSMTCSDDIFESITQPKMQVSAILEQIISCIYDLTKITEPNIEVRLAVTCDGYRWEWLADNPVWSSGYEVEELIKNQRSTFYQVYSRITPFEFHNSKIVANSSGKYLFDEKDQLNDNEGSIVCKEIYVGEKNKEFVRAILTISTYGKKLSDDENYYIIENVKNNIKEILKEYEIRLQVELSLFYMKYFRKKQRFDDLNDSLPVKIFHGLK